MFITGLAISPRPHSLIATVNRCPSNARSSRTVSFDRGTALPFASRRSSPDKRASRNLAAISGLIAASEILAEMLLQDDGTLVIGHL